MSVSPTGPAVLVFDLTSSLQASSVILELPEWRDDVPRVFKGPRKQASRAVFPEAWLLPLSSFLVSGISFNISLFRPLFT